MPSVFEKLVAAQKGGLAAAFGVPAVYTAPDGATTAGLSVRVHRHEPREAPIQARASGEAQAAEVLLLASSGLKPAKGGRFVVEGTEAWTILATPLLQNGEYTCTCERTGLERLMPRRAGGQA